MEPSLPEDCPFADTAPSTKFPINKAPSQLVLLGTAIRLGSA